MAADTPIMKCLKDAFAEFYKYAGSDGVAKGKEVDAFMLANFGEILKNPSHPETVKILVGAVEIHKDKGINVEEFAHLYCALVKAYAKGEVGVADKSYT
ncbi:repetin-like [Phyllobates terribilis]|uniref:repetin-like n=1 Tax=Phyllobates terribilis TaxID=111132 RepID=UPI003CCB01C3